jgi:GT2 family glycosyltransferase
MKISIVIPCRNEKTYIEECINAILQSKNIEGLEISIYIVDGMSDDGTRDVVETMCEKYPNIHLIDNVKQLTPFAFNLGIYAGGKVDFVQIIGARHIISDNYLVECIKILQNDASIWCVGGKIINEFTNKTGEIISAAMSTSFGMGLGNFRTLEKSGFTDTVTSPMYPYWVFEKIGFFDEELIRNQDDDFNFRVTNTGGKIYYCNEISLKYYVRATYKGLWRQFFQYGYWKVYVNQKHKAITTYRQLIPPLFVVYVFLAFLSLITCNGILILTAFLPFLLYLLLAKLISFKIVTPFSVSQFTQTFFVFPILHFSYGLGYLKGMFEFLLLKKKPSDKQKRLSR